MKKKSYYVSQIWSFVSQMT